MCKEHKDDLEAQKALYGVILERGNQCLSQASMRTGLGISTLEKAKDSLERKGFIRPVKNQDRRDKDYKSYEINT